MRGLAPTNQVLDELDRILASIPYRDDVLNVEFYGAWRLPEDEETTGMGLPYLFPELEGSCCVVITFTDGTAWFAARSEEESNAVESALQEKDAVTRLMALR